jgi:predicted ATPase
MKITAIELTNIRGFKKLPRTEFSKRINVLIGANNSGKSTILNSIFSVQRSNAIVNNDITIGEQNGEVKLFIEGLFIRDGTFNPGSSYLFNPKTNQRRLFNEQGTNTHNTGTIPEQEPNNLIYPYLSKRKSVNFNDQINEQNTNSVAGNFTNLFSKIDRLVTPQFQPGNSQYIKACNDILGFEISTLASPNGKKGAYFVHNQEHIPLVSMGEGVTNIIGLITDLCVADNKVFIIEEPENDIHPTALKSLMNFIIEKSANNQFFVSTHSNIVMKYLGGSDDAKIFNVKSGLTDPQRPKLFISSLTEVPNNVDERRAVLENLGYEFNDFGLWNAWLFLEESSAEILIREWFIKWYTPKLINKLRTFSANSLSQIIPKFDDFNKLFVFLHLESTYKNKVWVIVDGGKEETKIVEELRNIYTKNGWNEGNFSQFSEHDFENYYPKRFKAKVKTVLTETDKRKKREAKKLLLEEIKQWIISDEKNAKEEFKTSAEPVIDRLKEIARKI